MSDQKIYSELNDQFGDISDIYNSIYRLRAVSDEEINQIYQQIKSTYIGKYKKTPESAFKIISSALPFNLKYLRSYYSLFKKIFEEFHPKLSKDLSQILWHLLHNEYGIFPENATEMFMNEYNYRSGIDTVEVHQNNTIFRAIMDDDKDLFMCLSSKDDFDKDLKLINTSYPAQQGGYSLLELCCYYGSIDCFKLLTTKFQSVITQNCLSLSFLSGNPEIIKECLKYNFPNKDCMVNAIISHNIDLVIYLLGTKCTEIDFEDCGFYHNLQAFFLCLDLTKDFKEFFLLSYYFNNLPLCEYFLAHSVDVNCKNMEGNSYLNSYADIKEDFEVIEYLLSQGADINSKNSYGNTPLHEAALTDFIEYAEFLVSHGANINMRNNEGESAYELAKKFGREKIANILVSHGANTNKMNNPNQANGIHTLIQLLSLMADN